VELIRVGVLKTGNIATSLLVELLLDERADREDIDVKVISSGAKMTKEQVELTSKLLEFNPDLVIYITPNCSLPLPKKIISKLVEKKPTIVISDAPGIKIKDELEKLGAGYIFVKADAMIGARREFLDPIEMAIFNADMLKVLAITGALRAVHEAIDNAIESIKAKKVNLPKLVLDKLAVARYSGFANPYALAKAISAHIISEEVGKLNVEACFMTKTKEEYITKVASAHEMLRIASKLADEAREIEKANDNVLRKPHSKQGLILEKRRLFDKFNKPRS